MVKLRVVCVYTRFSAPDMNISTYDMIMSKSMKQLKDEHGLD